MRDWDLLKGSGDVVNGVLPNLKSVTPVISTYCPN